MWNIREYSLKVDDKNAETVDKTLIRATMKANNDAQELDELSWAGAKYSSPLR